MKQVVKFPKKTATAGSATVTYVIIRSENAKGRENAWAALSVERGTKQDYVVVAQFTAEEFGAEAWAQAAKYARRLADRLGIAYRKKRADEFEMA